MTDPMSQQEQSSPSVSDRYIHNVLVRLDAVRYGCDRPYAAAVARDAIEAIKGLVAQRSSGWQPMETAPTDGTHCILAVPTFSGFIYSVQGAFMKGKWMNAANIDAHPLAWMKNTRLPLEFCPWTDEYKARASKAEERVSGTLAEPSAKDALQAIANIPTANSLDRMNCHEDAYRAVENLFTEPPHIEGSPETQQYVMDVLKNLVIACEANGLRNLPFVTDARNLIAALATEGKS